MTYRPVTVDISLVRTEDRDRSEELLDELRRSLPELQDTPGPGAGAPLTRADDGSGFTAHLAVEADDDLEADRAARAAAATALGRLGFTNTDYLVDVVV